MTSQQICQYLTFNIGKPYTFVDVQGNEKAGETRNSLNAYYILLYSTTFRLYYQDVHVVHYYKCFDDSFSFFIGVGAMGGLK